MVNWKLQPAEAEESTALDGVHPVVVKLLKQRGVTEEAVKNFLTPSYDRDIHDPFLFSQMEKAVARIGVAKERGERIVIFGDYDADGVTSSAVLKRALDDLGAISEVYIPSKELEGYGMNVAAVDQLATTDIKLIITVDCGITNVEEVERANSHGLDVIITDHHHVPKKVPAAYAIINPKVEGCGYPFSSLAGVGVAFKLAQALYAKFMPEQAQQLKWLLDFVAIGTIADCVPLIDENRTIAKYGLIVLGKTRSVGLQEMFQVGRIAINEEQLPTSHQVSFQIAPRLNAAGRMGHANIAYNLIAGVNRVEARDHALDLEAKNQERQKVTERVVEEVRVLVRNAFKDKPFIFAVGEHFPSGILGLAAGRVADEFGKPTAIFQKGPVESKGSFRSIPQVNIIETIEQCSELLIKFGGHSQAAGVSVLNEKLEPFYERMNQLIAEKLQGMDLTPELAIDAELLPAEVDFNLTEGLQAMEPFGEGNEEPVFLMKNLIVHSVKTVGNGNKHLKLQLRPKDNSPKIFEAIGFRLAAENVHLKEGDVVSAVFNLSEDSWNGNRRIQMKLIDLRAVEK